MHDVDKAAGCFEALKLPGIRSARAEETPPLVRPPRSSPSFVPRRHPVRFTLEPRGTTVKPSSLLMRLIEMITYSSQASEGSVGTT
jgi:hypothetical protein